MAHNLYHLFFIMAYFFIGITILALIVFSIVSWYENEKQAAWRSLAILGTTLILIYFALFIPTHVQSFSLVFLSSVALLLLLIIAIPFHFDIRLIEKKPATQIDEREIMFSRRLLEPGTARYNEYYGQHPEHKEVDDHFRKNPGLLGKGSSLYQTFQFTAADASFDTISGMHHLVDKPEQKEKVSDLSAEKLTRFIKNWVLKLGAHSVGITTLRSYHKYSHIGRGPEFGQPVTLDHQYAIALTVEMDKMAMDAAPYAPTVMESAQQYVNSGVIAIQLTEFIRGLGFPARAHIDGNYRVVCPLVARDAGLGEIGRMGLLMTPKLGPRVRIAVVTTDAPLKPDTPEMDESVNEFCLRCKKCAEVCPSKAISLKDPEPIDGVTRWQINQEKCFTYWTVVGTDCGRCVSVCPYSHPDNLIHNMVRKGLRHSSAFQVLALKMDDLFYGRKPQPKDYQEFEVG